MTVARKVKTDDLEYGALMALASAAGHESQPFIELTTLLEERKREQEYLQKLEEKLKALFSDFGNRAEEILKALMGGDKAAEDAEVLPVMFSRMGLPGHLLYPISLMQAHSLKDKTIFEELLMELPGKKLQAKNKAATAARMRRRARGVLSAANGKYRARFLRKLLAYCTESLGMERREVEEMFNELTKVYAAYTGYGFLKGQLLEEAEYPA